MILDMIALLIILLVLLEISLSSLYQYSCIQYHYSGFIFKSSDGFYEAFCALAWPLTTAAAM